MFEEEVRRAVTSDVESAVKKAIENAKAELDRRIPEIVAGISIRVMQNVRMERFQNELVIHIRVEDFKPKV